MKRLQRLFLLLWVSALFFSAGCRQESAPTAVIKSSRDTTTENLEIVADGGIISLWADTTPADVTFKWTLNSARGALLADDEPSIQYQLPDSVSRREEVQISVTIIDADGNVGTDHLIIHLLPAVDGSIAMATAEAPPMEVAPTDTPTPAPTATAPPSPTPTQAPDPTAEPPAACHMPPSPLLLRPPSLSEIMAVYTDQPPIVDGCPDEAAWAQAPPLLYALHPAVNGATTAVARLLWDEAYLYVAFEVRDSHVESAGVAPWDGDTVAISLENGGQVIEYRHTLPQDVSSLAESAHRLLGITTFDHQADRDSGYSVEMRIPWSTSPAAGDAIAADFWSVDHDQNPGGRFDDPDTHFSALTWDGDQDTKTAGRRIWLVDEATMPPVLAANLANGDEAPRFIALMGEYMPGVSDAIWVFVRPPGGRFYPQSSNACAGEEALQRDGLWEVSISIGGADDTGELFEIVVATADAGASQLLSQTLQTWCRNEDYPGLETLPSGTVVQQELTVLRVSDGGRLPLPLHSASLAGNVEMISVEDGATVSATVTLTGTADTTLGGVIWALVYAPNGRYYPQSNNPCDNIHTTLAGARWQVRANLGGPHNAGETFVILMALADEAANAFLETVQAEGCANDHFPGLLTLELPMGLDEKARAVVTRQ
jgi:hypothetical protein